MLLSIVPDLSKATIDLFVALQAHLLPTPTRPHYSFSLRDMRRLLQGMAMANPRQVRKPTQLARLWVHECSRVFADRLVSSDDRQWFTESMRAAVNSVPILNYEMVVPGDRPLAYTNFMQTAKDLRKYEEVSDDIVLRTTAEQYLSSHDEMVTANSAAGTRAAMAAGAKAAKKEAVAKMMGGSSGSDARGRQQRATFKARDVHECRHAPRSHIARHLTTGRLLLF